MKRVQYKKYQRHLPGGPAEGGGLLGWWASSRRRYVELIVGSILVILIPLAIATLQRPEKTSAAWFSDNWTYRQIVALTNAGSAQTDYQVSITLDTTTLINAGKMQSDCDDIRITDINGKLLPHWIEENNPGCNSSTTAIWTKVPSIPTTGATVYVYYGNPSVSSVQSGTNVFLFFDDFNGSSLDGSKWTNLSSGTYTLTQSSGKLKLNTSTVSSGAEVATINATTNGSTTFALEQKLNVTNSTGTNIRNRNYLCTSTACSSKPLAFDHGMFSQATGPQPDVYWNGFTSTTVPTAVELKIKQILDGTNFSFSITNLSTGASVYSNSAAQAGLTYNYVRLGSTRDSGGSGTSEQNYDWVFIRKHAATAPSVAAPASEEKSPGPIAYWKFDEGVDNTCSGGANDTCDSTQNAYDAFNSGATWKPESECLSGKCLYFNGASDNYVQTTKSLTIPTSYTLSTWMRGERTKQIAENIYLLGWDQKISLSTQDGGQSVRGGILIRNAADTGYYGVWSLVDTSDNKWHQLVATVDRSTLEVKIYVDGNLKKTDTIADHFSGSAVLNAGAWTGNYGNFTGFLDETKIYHYVRTAAQVKADYTSRGAVKGVSAALGGNNETMKQLSNGLVGYWKMDESSWTNDCSTAAATDSSGNGNSGKSCPNAGGTQPASGKYGNAASIDGSNDYVAITDNAVYDWSKLTVSAWIYANDTTESGIISKGIQSGSTMEYGLNVTSGAKLQFFIDDNGAWGPVAYSISTANVPTSQWTHVVGTYDGSTLKLFVNGTEVDSDSYSSSVLNSTGAINIGTYYSINASDCGGATCHFNGKIDEARVYNRALSPAEVLQLSKFAPGPIYYATFDEGSGSNLYDKSGNGYNGSLVNSPTWDQGKFGDSLSFDGSSNQRVTVSSFGSYAPTEEITISLWQKASENRQESTIWIGADTPDRINVHVPWSNGIVYWDFGVCCTDGRLSYTPPSSILGTWNHFAFVASKQGNYMRIYRNGVLEASKTGYSTFIRAAYDMRIGQGGSETTYYKGGIDEVKIYDYARNSEQIVEDMNAGHPGVGSPVGSAIGYWKFDEGADNTCSGGTNDACNSGSQGSTLDGAFSSATWTQSGKFGKAVSTGSNKYVSVADNAALNLQNGITVTAWVNATSFAADSYIVTDFGYSGSYLNKRGYAFRVSSSNSKLNLTVTSDGTDGTAISAPGNTALSTGTWYHVAFTYNGSNIIIYLNGKNDGSTAWSSNIYQSNCPTIIGAQDCGSPAWFFGGTIDEVKIYNFALTPDQILLDMNRGSGLVLGAMGDNSSYDKNAANQEYCIPGDSTSCAAPAGYWSFNEKTGSAVYDKSGNGNTGTLNNSATWGTGKYGGGLSLTTGASTNNMTTSTATNLSSSGALTLEAWVYPTSYTAEEMTVIWGASPAAYYLSINLDGAINCYWYNTSPAGYHSSGASTVPLNQWTHIACAWDGSNIRLYTNGVLKNTVGVTGDGTDPTSINIGAEGTARQFRGIIDEAKIFTYSRSAAQVAYDYNRGKPVGWWKFDECQGGTAYDYSGNPTTYNGTITLGSGGQTSVGTCTASGSTAWYDGRTGKFNSSLNFDGNDDYVDNTSVSFNRYTWSMWFKADATSNYLGGSSTYVFMRFGANCAAGKINLGNNMGGAWNEFCTNTTFSTGTWYHVVYTYDGSNQKVYVNGNLENTDVETGTTSTTGFEVGTIPWNKGLANNSFDGLIDDVRIYNYALTPSQIKNVYNEGSAIRFGPSTGSP